MNPINNRSDIVSVLQQMQTMRQAAQASLDADMQTPDAPASRPVDQTNSFQGMFEAAIRGVNEVQSESAQMSNAFVRGETDDLVQVMIQSQKANVGFQALTQVRNRMVSAYQEIMNMRI